MSFDEHPESQEDLFDPSLGQLRDQVKKVMIPLLIKTFELKLAAQQTKTPPSRLHKQVAEPPEKILKQLNKLHDNLKQLQLWCHSCQNQISKALDEIEGGFQHNTKQPSISDRQSAVEKSFLDAITSKVFQLQSKKQSSRKLDATHEKNQSWIVKWFSRQQKPE